MVSKTSFKLVCTAARVALFFWHPVFRVYGRENIPEDGALLVCPNHSGMADPFWAIFALKPEYMPRVMAKKELMGVPVIGSLLRWLGVFGVDRSGADVNAVKMGLKCLKDGQRLLLFPEGTRVKKGNVVKPKGGAILLSYRTGAPILPVYISPRKYPFCTVVCVIGKPVTYHFADKKPCEEEILAAAADLMQKTYALRDTVCR